MRVLYLLALLSLTGCYESEKTDKAETPEEKSFQFKETIVTGKDTGMKSIAGFSPNNITDVLCQHWVGGYSNDLGEFCMYKDSLVFENPRSDTPRIGKWQIHQADDYRFLILRFARGGQREYILRDVKPTLLTLGGLSSYGDIVTRRYESDGEIHKDMLNDPFHPSNNQWRIAPKKPESDSAIHARARGCVKFFALFFRDNIKRREKRINFEGLPAIFQWYGGGIGLVGRDEITKSWIACFYDRKDAVKGHAILRKLIVDFDFDWPKNAPNWVYETHSVLEQMYHKMGY